MTAAAVVNLEPSPDGYEIIARQFVASCAADINPERRASALRVLAELLHVAGYLATLPDGAQRIERLKLVTVSLGVMTGATPGRPSVVDTLGGLLALLDAGSLEVAYGDRRETQRDVDAARAVWIEATS